MHACIPDTGRGFRDGPVSLAHDDGPGARPRGHGLLLRAPQMPDYVQWSELREMSRLFLTPWEPDLAIR